MDRCCTPGISHESCTMTADLAQRTEWAAPRAQHPLSHPGILFSLAMRACLAVSVSPGLSILVTHLTSRVTLAVRADTREPYLAIHLAFRRM